MSSILNNAARESEILALKLQEEELRLQHDALLAQRLALSYACRANDDQDDDVEFVLEVSAGAEDTAQLALVEKQLAEVQNKRSRLAVEDLQEVRQYQERLARSSRVVAESLQQHERWRARIAQHDAAFARRLDNIDSDDWDDYGDDIEDPLDLPPPRDVPKVKDEPVPAAVYRLEASDNADRCNSNTNNRATTTTQRTTQRPTTRAMTKALQQPSAPSQPCPGGGTRAATAPTSARQGAAGSSGSGGSSTRAAARAVPSGAGGPAASAAKAAPSGSAATAAAAGRAGGASTSAPARAGGPAAATIECLCCFDRFPEGEVTCAGADAASSSTASAGCGHYFCNGCITEYVRGAVKDGKFPIGCPMAAGGGAAGGGGGGGRAAQGGAGGGARQQQQPQGGCRLKFSRQSVLAILQRHPKELQAFGVLEVEQTIDQSMRIYCPHKSCSALLVRPDPEDMPKDTPISCPACSRMFCVNCLIPGWHHGYTCAAFQALPAHLRSAEDAAMLQLSERQQWKRCPACKLIVERSEGCNHMRCRCGCDFCYGCGKPYKDTRPTPDNVHGTPACGCPLFDVPEDIEEEEEEQAPQQPQENHAGGAGGGYGGYGQGHNYAAPAPAPWRGGRVVKRRRCRYSASIYGCPYGSKCWYWHEEDDG
ncbi:hypothetical protein PLESTB_001117400 [Pleodorina starrii]|uniref:RBR-type E3 ubiquitin transferase n=1 Tax=Pleodorina starrii TaxID=330485 RepID=A0A9W6BQI2_9CHLO|nr:hypothetical protein PLESTM_001354600 [Pleodorina starrii]GLC56531.1 hypothetical protein PLESTB_001117400 [Pleodorina starrii]GLC68774.1 hypothetical protein PLESTF_000735300 [Pleodorina starrii]